MALMLASAAALAESSAPDSEPYNVAEILFMVLAWIAVFLFIWLIVYGTCGGPRPRTAGLWNRSTVLRAYGAQ